MTMYNPNNFSLNHNTKVVYPLTGIVIIISLIILLLSKQHGPL